MTEFAETLKAIEEDWQERWSEDGVHEAEQGGEKA